MLVCYSRYIEEIIPCALAYGAKDRFKCVDCVLSHVHCDFSVGARFNYFIGFHLDLVVDWELADFVLAEVDFLLETVDEKLMLLQPLVDDIVAETSVIGAVLASLDVYGDSTSDR